MALYGLFASFPQGFRLVTFLRQMINYERLIELERSVGNRTSLFLTSVNLYWALKNEVPFLLHLSVWFCCHTVFHTYLIFLIRSNHTPWHVMNVFRLENRVTCLLKSHCMWMHSLLWYCRGIFEDVEGYKHCEGILWASAWEYCVFCECVKIPILAVCHRMMWE